MSTLKRSFGLAHRPCRSTVWANVTFARNLHSSTRHALFRPRDLGTTNQPFPHQKRNFWWNSKPAPTDASQIVETTEPVAVNPSVDIPPQVLPQDIPTSPVDIEPQVLSFQPEDIPTSPVEVEPMMDALIDPGTALTIISDPTLQSMGLYSWWPPGAVIHMHEWLHLSIGLPWVSTICFSALLLRLMAAPFLVIGQRHSLRMARAQPKMKPLMAQMEKARQDRDPRAVAQVHAQMKTLYAEYEFKPLAAVLPMFQIPLMFGQFLGVRNIMQSDLPSLKDSGIQSVLDPLISTGDWLKDLTAPDPFYIMPIVAALMINLQLSVAAGQQDLVTRPVVGHTMNAFRVLSGVSLIFTSHFSAGLNLSLLVGTAFFVGQNLVLRSPAVRKYCKLLPLPKYIPNAKGKLVPNVPPSFSESLSVWRAWIKSPTPLFGAVAPKRPVNSQQRGKRW